MKKKGTLWMLLPVVCALLMAACSGGSGDDGGGSSESGSVTMTVRATSPNMDCEIIQSAYDATEVSTRFVSGWTEGSKVTLWAKQGAKLIYCGEATQNGDASGQHTVKVIHFDGSAVLDPTQPYLLYGLWCDWRRDGEELFYRNDLHRGGSFGTFFKAVGQKGTTSVNEQVAGTVEMLYLINKSGKTIKFRHKGYDAEKKWYYTHAEVSMDKGTVVNAEQGAEAVSDVTDIPVFTGNFLGRSYSYYVPNGNKIENAQLICEIDGKEVRSENRISSDITLQTNHVYGIFAVWDGERLTLGDGEGKGVIELPEGANVTMNQVSVVGDGQSVEVGSDGSFESEASNLFAYNNDHLMYLNVSPGRFEEQQVALNGIESAASIATMLFPDVFQELSLEQFTLLKIGLAQLQETKDLGAAIDKTVAAKGYFEIADVKKEYDALRARFMPAGTGIRRTANHSRRRIPVEPCFYLGTNRSNKVYGNGYRVELKSCTWLPDGTDQTKNPVWQCDFTVYNQSRYCYLFVMEGYLGSDGLYHPSTEYPDQMFRYMVKPQGISNLMDFGTVTDIATLEILRKPISTIRNWDFSKITKMIEETVPIWQGVWEGKAYDTTWDTVEKSGIKLDFEQGENQLLVLGPYDNLWLSVFNVWMKMTVPAFKIYQGLNGNGGDKNDGELWKTLFVEYLKDLKDYNLDTYMEIINCFDEPKPLVEMVSVVGKKVMTTFADFMAKKGDKLLTTGIMASQRKSLEKVVTMFKEAKNVGEIMEVVELVYSGCDLILGFLDWEFSGTSFNMLLDYNETKGDIDIIPGFEI